MPPNRYRGPPMTLANRRENGEHSLSVTCALCHREAVMNVDAFGDAIPVPAFAAHGLHRLRGSSAHSVGRIGRSERVGRS